jgi:hypothetical protein
MTGGMTVTELIESLRELPGDPDLRHVQIRLMISRPYASEEFVACAVSDVDLVRDQVVLSGHGFMGGL